jgi:hypothetical protein
MAETALNTVAEQTWLEPLAEPLSAAVHGKTRPVRQAGG